MYNDFKFTEMMKKGVLQQLNELETSVSFITDFMNH